MGWAVQVLLCTSLLPFHACLPPPFQFLKLFIPALCTSICDSYKQFLVFGESTLTYYLQAHFCAIHLVMSSPRNILLLAWNVMV